MGKKSIGRVGKKHKLVNLNYNPLLIFNPIPGVCANLYIPTWMWLKDFFSFDVIMLDIFCENLAYVAPPLQIL